LFTPIDRYLDSWTLRQLELERTFEMEGWIDQPTEEVHYPEDWDTPLRYTPEEVKEVARQIKVRVRARLDGQRI
jgi:hypothetical protein